MATDRGHVVFADSPPTFPTVPSVLHVATPNGADTELDPQFVEFFPHGVDREWHWPVDTDAVVYLVNDHERMVIRRTVLPPL